MPEFFEFNRGAKAPVKHRYNERWNYRRDHTADSCQQSYLLEKLRYKWGGYKDGFRCIQRLSNLAEKLGLKCLIGFRWNRR